MTYDRVHTGDLDVGGIISGTFGSIGRNLPTVLCFALVSAAPQAVIQYGIVRGQTGVLGDSIWYVFLAGGLLSIVASMITNIAMIRIVIEDAQKRKASLGECLGTVARYALPGLAVEFLYTVGYLFSLMLLIIPGLIFMTAFRVVLPVLVAEKKGIFESFSRSARLTDGYRLAIFGTMFLLGIIVGVANLIPAGVGIAITTSGNADLGAIVQGASAGAVQVITLASISVIYIRLVRLREGGEASRLAEVFA
jgi:hypothetical protein